ncbi:MAG: hypothetical protein ABMB14_26810 [Myxococcota bacterium]
MILALAGCAVRHVPHYEPVDFALDPPEPAFVARMPALLDRGVGSRWLRGWGAVDPTVTTFDDVPPEAAYAVWSFAEGWARGAELDIQVDVGQGPRAVTVWWSVDRRAVVDWSDAVPWAVADPGPPEAIAARFGLAAVSGPFTADELADLATGLAALSHRELAAVRGLSFDRSDTSPRAPRRELAYYDPNPDPATLSLFDLAFDADRTGFVGPVDRPIRSGAMTVLHEVGHALVDLPSRTAYAAYATAYDRYLAAPDPATSELAYGVVRAAWRRYRGIGPRGPVIAAWQRFRAGRPGPSTYGFRAPHESFAEAFALYHLDPAALDRALPGAVAWFASGAHLEAAGAPPE